MSISRGEFEELGNEDVDEIGNEEEKEDEADETIEKVTARRCAAVANVRSFCQKRKFNP